MVVTESWRELAIGIRVEGFRVSIMGLVKWFWELGWQQDLGLMFGQIYGVLLRFDNCHLG